MLGLRNCLFHLFQIELQREGHQDFFSLSLSLTLPPLYDDGMIDYDSCLQLSRVMIVDRFLRACFG